MSRLADSDMSPKRRALLVSYYFPPRFSIGGKRAHRFARYLPEFGWSTTILTALAPSHERLDPSFSDADLVDCDIRRDYLTAEEVARMPQRALGSDGTIEAPSTSWNSKASPSIWNRIRSELRFPSPIGPDAYRIGTIARRIADVARDARAEIIFASGSPWETVVAGGIAARMTKLPLVVDLRDPWSFGPLMARRPAWVRTVDGAIENALLRRADALVVTTELTRDAYAKRRAARRVECIRNAFDPAIVPVPTRHEKITLIHFGNCYGNRNLEPFLRALALVLRHRPNAPVRIFNLGRVAESDVALVRELGIEKHFEYTTVVPYSEGINLVAGADLALLPSFGDEPWFIPGKLYDYLLTQTPMLVIDQSSEIASIVEQTRLGWVVSRHDVSKLAECIEHTIDARSLGQPLVSADKDVISALSARGTARQLASLFDAIVR